MGVLNVFVEFYCRFQLNKTNIKIILSKTPQYLLITNQLLKNSVTKKKKPIDEYLFFLSKTYKMLNEVHIYIDTKNKRKLGLVQTQVNDHQGDLVRKSIVLSINELSTQFLKVSAGFL